MDKLYSFLDTTSLEMFNKINEIVDWINGYELTKECEAYESTEAEEIGNDNP